MFLIWEKSCILILRASFDFLRRLSCYNISFSIDLWSEYLLHLTLWGFVTVLDFTSKPSCIIESSFSMWFQCPIVCFFVFFLHLSMCKEKSPLGSRLSCKHFFYGHMRTFIMYHQFSLLEARLQISNKFSFCRNWIFQSIHHVHTVSPCNYGFDCPGFRSEKSFWRHFNLVPHTREPIIFSWITQD